MADWQAFATAFLTDSAKYITENKDRAAEYRDKIKEQAEKNKSIFSQRKLAANSILQQIKTAEGLNASPGMIRSALDSGADGVLRLNQQLMQMKKDVEAGGGNWTAEAAKLRINVPEFFTNMQGPPTEGYKAQVYKQFGVTSGEMGSSKKPEQSMLRTALGFNAKDFVRASLDEDSAFGTGMSTYDLSQLDATLPYTPSGTQQGYITYNAINEFDQKAQSNSLRDLKNQMPNVRDNQKWREARAYIDLVNERNYSNVPGYMGDDAFSKLDALERDAHKQELIKAQRKIMEDIQFASLNVTVNSGIKMYGDKYLNDPGIAMTLDNFGGKGYSSRFGVVSDAEEISGSVLTSELFDGVISETINNIGADFNIDKDFSEREYTITGKRGGNYTFRFKEDGISYESITIRNPEGNVVQTITDPTDLKVLSSNGQKEFLTLDKYDSYGLSEDTEKALGTGTVNFRDRNMVVGDPPDIILPTKLAGTSQTDIAAGIEVLGADLEKYKTEGNLDLTKIKKGLKGWLLGNRSPKSLKEAIGSFSAPEADGRIDAYVRSIMEQLTTDTSVDNTTISVSDKTSFPIDGRGTSMNLIDNSVSPSKMAEEKSAIEKAAMEKAIQAALIEAVRAGEIDKANVLAQQLEDSTAGADGQMYSSLVREDQTRAKALEDAQADLGYPPREVIVSDTPGPKVDVTSPKFEEYNIVSRPDVSVSEDNLPKTSSAPGLGEGTINIDAAPAIETDEPSYDEDKVVIEEAKEYNKVIGYLIDNIKPNTTLGRLIKKNPDKLKINNSQLRNMIVKALGGPNALPKSSKERNALVDKYAKVYIEGIAN